VHILEVFVVRAGFDQEDLGIGGGGEAAGEDAA
jgi:hypothetical protein